MAHRARAARARSFFARSPAGVAGTGQTRRIAANPLAPSANTPSENANTHAPRRSSACRRK
ncbi:MAG: hypothetical protein NT031_07330 [Planctomycetota bacterium]|nr:hypothetical protein [Planctomycetota bacterium]